MKEFEGRAQTLLEEQKIVAQSLAKVELLGQGFLSKVRVTSLSLVHLTNNFSSLKATLEKLMPEIHAGDLKIQDLSTQIFEIEKRI